LAEPAVAGDPRFGDTIEQHRRAPGGEDARH
jgi:hypothetical protein